MKAFKANIEREVLGNDNFRKVIYTGVHSQLVLMSLAPKTDIGLETHKDTDQFFRFEKGSGKVILDEDFYLVSDGDAVLVPAGSKHIVINTSETEPLRLYTIYSPPHHKDGLVQATKLV